MPQDALIRLSALLAVLAAPGTALAQSCGFLDVPALAFGTYDPFGPSTLKADVPITIGCEAGSVGFTVGVADPAAGRVMTRSGGSAIGYRLVDQDGTPLGDDGVGIAGITGGNGEASVRIFGEIPPGQNVGPGQYGDVVTLILTLDP